MSVDDRNWRIRVIGRGHNPASVELLREAAGKPNVTEHHDSAFAYLTDGQVAVNTVEHLKRNQVIDAQLEHWDPELVEWRELDADEAIAVAMTEAATRVAGAQVSGPLRPEKPYVPVSEQLRDSGLLGMDDRPRWFSQVRTPLGPESQPPSSPPSLATALRTTLVRGSLYLGGIACLAIGVLVPAPNVVRAIIGISGIGLLLAHIIRAAKSPSEGELLEYVLKRVPREPARRAAITVGVVLGLAGSGYVWALLTGHGLKGDETTPQLDQSSTYPNADAAILGTIAACMIALYLIGIAPHWKSNRTRVTALTSLFVLGGIGFALAHRLFRA